MAAITNTATGAPMAGPSMCPRGFGLGLAGADVMGSAPYVAAGCGIDVKVKRVLETPLVETTDV